MASLRIFFRAAALAALALTFGPAGAQVFKCTGPNGRVEYASKPCESGQGQAMPVQGRGATAASGPRASSSAPAAPARSGSGVADPVSARARVAYFDAVRCERVRIQLEVLRAEIAKIEAEKTGDPGLRSPREVGLRENLTLIEQGQGRACSQPQRWLTSEDGVRPDDCRALFAELRRHTKDSYQFDGPAKDRADDVQQRLANMNCAAPR